MHVPILLMYGPVKRIDEFEEYFDSEIDLILNYQQIRRHSIQGNLFELPTSFVIFLNNISSFGLPAYFPKWLRHRMGCRNFPLDGIIIREIAQKKY